MIIRPDLIEQEEYSKYEQLQTFWHALYENILRKTIDHQEYAKLPRSVYLPVSSSYLKICDLEL